MFDVEKIREDFPILKREVKGNPLIYLDSASTSQKPMQVIDAVSNFYEKYNANIHRSVYDMAEEATEEYEGTRDKIRKFLNAKDYEIIFTKNCTEAINIVATGWAMRNLKGGDSVTLSMMEHHSNIVPWQRLRSNGVALRFMDVDDDGKLKPEKIKDGTKIVSLTHASNVLGTINDVQNISKECRENGSLFMVDGAQSVPHMEVDLGKIGCDFMAFSGHKMLGPTGIGVLAVRKNLTDEMDPILFGSDMIKEVTPFNTTFADSPSKFETGTPNIAGVVGMSAAIDYLSKLGMKNVENHERDLTKHALEKLSEIKRIKIFGPKENRGGVVSFNLGDIHSHDIATILNEKGIAIRSGHHCAQPLMKRFGVNSMSRASFYLYNTKDEVDSFVDSLGKAGGVFKI